MMDFLVLSIFPDMFENFWNHGIIARALAQKKISAQAVNIRDFAAGRHRITDDRPFGGGFGMVMKPEPLTSAIQYARQRLPNAQIVLLTPQGQPFNQSKAAGLAALSGLVFVCGRYEGIDERVCGLVDHELSLGDYVLTGGELGAMVIIDAVTRLIPGVLGGQGSAEADSFSNGLIEHAQYTRPRSFDGQDVPDVLLSGNHQELAQWRQETALLRTLAKRPDLLGCRPLTETETAILKKWRKQFDDIIQAQSVSGADPLSGHQ